MKCTITKAAIWTRVIDEKGELVAYFTNPKHASFFAEALKILPPEPPEWPKTGEWYIWNMNNPALSNSVRVNEVKYQHGDWWIDYRIESDKEDNQCRLGHFQSQCKDYQEWKKWKEAQQ